MRKCQATYRGECFAEAIKQCQVCEKWFCNTHAQMHTTDQDFSAPKPAPVFKDRDLWTAIYIMNLCTQSVSVAEERANEALAMYRKYMVMFDAGENVTKH